MSTSLTRSRKQRVYNVRRSISKAIRGIRGLGYTKKEAKSMINKMIERLLS